MALYDLKVVVEFFYEVEADSAEEAEDFGWHYEDYLHSGEVYSIKVTEAEEYVETFASDQDDIDEEDK
jgi:hypothetical protein